MCIPNPPNPLHFTEQSLRTSRSRLRVAYIPVLGVVFTRSCPPPFLCLELYSPVVAHHHTSVSFSTPSIIWPTLPSAHLVGPCRASHEGEDEHFLLPGWVLLQHNLWDPHVRCCQSQQEQQEALWCRTVLGAEQKHDCMDRDRERRQA
jgi:hypothetical protein